MVVFSGVQYTCKTSIFLSICNSDQLQLIGSKLEFDREASVLFKYAAGDKVKVVTSKLFKVHFTINYKFKKP